MGDALQRNSQRTVNELSHLDVLGPTLQVSSGEFLPII